MDGNRDAQDLFQCPLPLEGGQQQTCYIKYYTVPPLLIRPLGTKGLYLDKWAIQITEVNK